VHRIQVSLARAGQGQSAVMTDKQRCIEIGFQLAYLLADSGLRNFEIFRGLGETHSPAGGLKSTQNI
jgi:hypothetical protein